MNELIKKRRILIAVKKAQFFIILSLLALSIYGIFNSSSMNEEQTISTFNFMYSLVFIFITLVVAELIFKRPIASFLFKRRNSCRCPFFGFVRDEKDFIDQLRDTCAFNTNPSSPCLMKSNNQIPNWIECHLNKEKERKILSKICMSSSFVVKNTYFSEKLNFWKWFNAKVT